MRRFTLVALSLLMIAVSFGFRGGTWRGERTIAGNYTFEDAVVFSGLVTIDKQIMLASGDTLIIRDGTGADTTLSYDNGTNAMLVADNPWRVDELVADTLQVPVGVNAKTSTNGYASIFVDTVGTDSLIILVGSTRRGAVIQ